MAYRKSFSELTWHWREECTRWPSKEYGEVDSVHSIFNPTTDSFCSDCQGIDRDARQNSRKTG